MQLRHLTIAIALALPACGNEAPPVVTPAVPAAAPAPAPSAPSSATSAATAPALIAVQDVSFVCMINNQLMAKPQIPVEVEGRTYYGCCAMCKDRLANDPASRQAIDPATGATVDKAKAVIASDADGAVYYFASAETLSQYGRR